MTDTTKLLDGFEDWLAKWEKTMGEKHLFHDVAAFARIGASVMPRPIDDIAKERERQKSVEGWTPEHDDTHYSGELARAAACYAIPPDYSDPEIAEMRERLWPWEYEQFKPKRQRQDLIRAGALIVAEIERLDRASGRQEDFKNHTIVSGEIEP